AQLGEHIGWQSLALDHVAAFAADDLVPGGAILHHRVLRLPLELKIHRSRSFRAGSGSGRSELSQVAPPPSRYTAGTPTEPSRVHLNIPNSLLTSHLVACQRESIPNVQV